MPTNSKTCQVFRSTQLACSVADQGSGAFLTSRSGIQDPGWIKNQDPGSGSVLNILNQISESLETSFWVKKLKFFDVDADPGSGNLFDPGCRIRSGTYTDPDLG